MQEGERAETHNNNEEKAGPGLMCDVVSARRPKGNESGVVPAHICVLHIHLK